MWSSVLTVTPLGSLFLEGNIWASVAAALIPIQGFGPVCSQSCLLLLMSLCSDFLCDLFLTWSHFLAVLCMYTACCLLFTRSLTPAWLRPSRSPAWLLCSESADWGTELLWEFSCLQFLSLKVFPLFHMWGSYGNSGGKVCSDMGANCCLYCAVIRKYCWYVPTWYLGMKYP